MSSLLAYLRGNSISFMHGRGGDGDHNNTHGKREGMATACRKRCGNGVGMGTKTHCNGVKSLSPCHSLVERLSKETFHKSSGFLDYRKLVIVAEMVMQHLTHFLAIFQINLG